jgi:hypothetical protein
VQPTVLGSITPKEVTSSGQGWVSVSLLTYTCLSDEYSKKVSEQTFGQRISLARSCNPELFNNFWKRNRRIAKAVRRLLQPKVNHQVSPLVSLKRTHDKRIQGDAIEADIIPQQNSLRRGQDSEEILNLGHIRDARRLITQINNDLSSTQSDLNDICEILAHANAEITKAQGIVKDMIEGRIEFEESIVKRLHLDRHLWDGTGLMPARHRVKWRAFVSEIEKKRTRTEVGQRDEEQVQESLDSNRVDSE